jgi:hypothetical protein
MKWVVNSNKNNAMAKPLLTGSTLFEAKLS